MPRYYFDIKNGHRLVDPSGLDCENDIDAIRKAGAIAAEIASDKPEVDPTRHIAIINDARTGGFQSPGLFGAC